MRTQCLWVLLIAVLGCSEQAATDDSVVRSRATLDTLRTMPVLAARIGQLEPIARQGGAFRIAAGRTASSWRSAARDRLVRELPESSDGPLRLAIGDEPGFCWRPAAWTRSSARRRARKSTTRQAISGRW
jgi:hypothetical protein